MRKNKKRAVIISAVLLVAITAAVFLSDMDGSPFFASAAGLTQPKIMEAPEGAVYVDGVGTGDADGTDEDNAMESIADAFAAAGSGGTVVVCGDISPEEAINKTSVNLLIAKGSKLTLSSDLKVKNIGIYGSMDVLSSCSMTYSEVDIVGSLYVADVSSSFSAANLLTSAKIKAESPGARFYEGAGRRLMFAINDSAAEINVRLGGSVEMGINIVILPPAAGLDLKIDGDVDVLKNFTLANNDKATVNGTVTVSEGATLTLYSKSSFHATKVNVEGTLYAVEAAPLSANKNTAVELTGAKAKYYEGKDTAKTLLAAVADNSAVISATAKDVLGWTQTKNGKEYTATGAVTVKRDLTFGNNDKAEVNGTVTISEGATLTINGSSSFFAEQINVEGTLYALAPAPLKNTKVMLTGADAKYYENQDAAKTLLAAVADNSAVISATAKGTLGWTQTQNGKVYAITGAVTVNKNLTIGSGDKLEAADLAIAKGVTLTGYKGGGTVKMYDTSTLNCSAGITTKTNIKVIKAGETMQKNTLISAPKSTDASMIVFANGADFNNKWKLMVVSEDAANTREWAMREIFKLVFKNGETVVSEASVAEGETIAAPGALAHTADKTFTGWETFPSKMPNSDLTVSAIFLPKVPVKAEITTQPKTQYIIRQTLDISAGVIKITYDNDTVESVKMTDSRVAQISAVSLTSVGTKTLKQTFTHNSKTINVPDISITVVDRKLTKITVKSNPYKDGNPLVGNTVNLTGMVITEHYDNGETADITVTSAMNNLGTVKVSPKIMAVSGENTFTITYKEKTATFKMVVYSATPERITIDDSSDNFKKSYYLGEKLDLSNGFIYVISNNQTQVRVSMTSSAVKVTGFNPNKLGKQELTVSYVANSNLTLTASDKLVVTVKEKPTYKKGDVNNKDGITMSDYALVKAHLLGTKTLTGMAFDAADINGDARVTMADYALLKAHLLGTKLIKN